jgi:predicted transcriptional regulator
MVKNRRGMRGPAARAKQGAKVHAYRARDPEKVKATIEKDLCESFQCIHRT